MSKSGQKYYIKKELLKLISKNIKNKKMRMHYV